MTRISSCRSFQLLFLLEYFILLVNCSNENNTDSDISDDGSNSLVGIAEVLTSSKGIQVGPAVAAIVAILGGGVICMAGYRLFRPTVFCCAFLMGGLFVASILERAFSSMDWMPTASYLGFAIGGSIAGVLVLMLYSASIFLAGAVGGIMLACTFNVSVGAKIYPANPDVILVILALVLGILGGVLALKLEKPVLITTTAIVGAAVCVWGVGYFAGNYTNGAGLTKFRVETTKGEWEYRIPNARWGYLIGMLVLFILGMSVQISKTARGYDHSGQTGSHSMTKTSAHAAV